MPVENHAGELAVGEAESPAVVGALNIATANQFGQMPPRVRIFDK